MSTLVTRIALACIYDVRVAPESMRTNLMDKVSNESQTLAGVCEMIVLAGGWRMCEECSDKYNKYMN